MPIHSIISFCYVNFENHISSFWFPINQMNHFLGRSNIFKDAPTWKESSLLQENNMIEAIGKFADKIFDKIL